MEHWVTFWPTLVATLLGVLAAAAISAIAYWFRGRRLMAVRKGEVGRIEGLLAKSVEENARTAGKWAGRAKAADERDVKVIPSPIDSYRTETWDTLRHRYAELALDARRVALFSSFFEMVTKGQEASKVERDVYVASWSGDPRVVGQGVYRVAGHARLGSLGLAGVIVLRAAVILLELGFEPPDAETTEKAPGDLEPLVTIEDLEGLGKATFPSPDDKQAL